jgi:hypothetical protein
MTTPDYTKKMSDLRTLVGHHVKIPSKSAFSNMTSSIPTVNTQSPIFYVIPSVILIILLVVIKPSFLCEDNIDKDNVITSKINYKTLFIYGVVGGIILSIGLFAYFRKLNV